MSTVLIMGGSRGIGLQAVTTALARGYRVKAFARSAPEIEITDPKLDKVKGDALEPAQVAAALDGVDAVIQALGVPAGPEMVLRPVHLFSRATRVLLEAMADSGTRRLICLTGFGAGDSRASINCLQRFPFRLLLGRAYDDKSVQEELVRSSDLDWTIVRPGVLTNGAASGRYRILAERQQWRNGIISRADVADFLVRQVDDESYVGKTPVLIRYPL